MTIIPILLSSLVLTNACETLQAMKEHRLLTPIDLTATVVLTAPNDRSVVFGLMDATGEIVGSILRTNDVVDAIRTGDRIRAHGIIRKAAPNNVPRVYFRQIEVLGHGTAPEPAKISARQLRDPSYHHRLISLTGVVMDSFRDEIDPKNFFLVLDCDRETIYVNLVSAADLSDRLLELNNTEVEIRGYYGDGGNCSYRRIGGALVSAFDMRNVRVRRQPTDLFDAPELPVKGFDTPDGVRSLGRRRVAGSVAAVWQSRFILLRAKNCGDVTVELSAGQALPSVGQSVETVGLTETDLYNINLTHGIWRTADTPSPCEERPARDIRVRSLFTDAKGAEKIDPRFHGQVVRLTGIVRNISRDKTFILDDDAFTISVDCSAEPTVLNGISLGCKVRVSGVCIMDTDNWTPSMTFPHIRGFSIVVRNPADLTLISRPSWWSADRLLVVLGIMFVALVVIGIWNRILGRLVERRSRQLALEEIAHAKTELRAEERSRLSVELHDTIAQSIAGISLQLDSVQLAAENEPEILFSCIEATQRSLRNCRQNLRDCLWDLRSRAFEEKSIGAALARTLAPHKGSVRIDIDCPIRTEGKSDNAIHAILCIIRELTINAIRHGKSTIVTIRGHEEDRRLSFSVTDNGCGFDPETAPGLEKGHFGLQGVRERIHLLDGLIGISSIPERGTTVTLKGLRPDI